MVNGILKVLRYIFETIDHLCLQYTCRLKCAEAKGEPLGVVRCDVFSKRSSDSRDWYARQAATISTCPAFDRARRAITLELGGGRFPIKLRLANPSARGSIFVHR